MQSMGLAFRNSWKGHFFRQLEQNTHWEADITELLIVDFVCGLYEWNYVISRSILNNQLSILIFLFSSGESLSEFEHMSIFHLLLQLLFKVYFILKILHLLDNCIPKFSYSNLDLPIFDIHKNIFTYFYFILKSTGFQT